LRSPERSRIDRAREPFGVIATKNVYDPAGTVPTTALVKVLKTVTLADEHWFAT
jgi:hypothetical protein